MLGAPGAGKGTQAQRIAAARKLPHVSTGDIFRAHLKGGTELGKRVQKYLDAGALVPDELTCEIVYERLAEADCGDGYVLDGFPRSIPQAEGLERFLDGRDEGLSAAVDIDVPDDEIVGRLTNRRTCANCGAIFNLKFGPHPTGDATHCDRCGGDLVQRDDDREETIRHRLKVYHETTKPLLEFYQSRGLLRSIPAAGMPPDTVFEKIEEALRAVTTAETS
jgi:adenylate kinase